MTEITFFERFEADILAKKKTITIRDKSESHFPIGQPLKVSTLEQGRHFCDIQLTSIVPITLDALTEVHAQQENMSLSQLKAVIKDIYPTETQFFVLTFYVL